MNAPNVLTITLLLLLISAALRADAPLPVPVRVGEVIRRNVAAGKVFIGTVEPTRRSIVGSAVAGRVDKVFVEEGDLVDPSNGDFGQLVQLRQNTARIELAVAAAELEATKQQLAELIQGPRAEEIQRLEAQAKGAAAVREFAIKRFDRLADLFQRDAAAQGNLDEALSAKVAAEQRYIAAQAEHEAARRGTRKEQLAQAKARVTKAEEEVNRLRDQLENHTIRAPFRGYVVKRFAEKGTWVQLGGPIAEIMELDPVEVRVAVPEESITRVKQGADVIVEVASIQSERTHLDGKVFRVIPSADQRSRSFPVRIRISNPSTDGLPLLKPGMLAKVTLAVGRGMNALLVPKDALVLDRNTATVFAIVSGENVTSVSQIHVNVGATRDSLVQVTPIGAKLLPGMRVVIEGNERLESGQSVSILAD